MTNDQDNIDARLLQKAYERQAAEMERLKSGGGGGTFDGMDGRVSRLEAHMEHVRTDMSEIKLDLKATLSKLNELPTKADLNTWRWQWIATGVAIIALTVGGITGGLALIASYAN